MRYRVHEVLQRLVRILAAMVGLEVVETVNGPEVAVWLSSADLDLEDRSSAPLRFTRESA